jgi:hypothetical protein
VLVLAVQNLGNLLGVAPDHPLTWIIPVAFVVIGLLGVLWGVILRVARQDVYARIGLGAKSATAAVGPLPVQFANR